MQLQKRVLKNGITVIHEKRDLPVIALSITNKFGAAFEEAKIKGIAHVIEHLVFTGTKTRTHEDISKEIEKKGGVLNAFTSHEVTSFWFKLPSKHIFAGLDILTDMLNNPSFPIEKFEKEKKVILEEIKLYHDNPSFSVSEQIEKNLFAPPFGNLIVGSKETVSSLKREFVIDYFKKKYAPSNYLVTLVGSADFNKVCTYLEKNFKKEKTNLQIIPIKKKNVETVEERAGIDQANFVLAMHAPLFSSKEFAALNVLDAYLANGMSSRLFLEIREKRGLAYSVRGSISAEKSFSYYAIYAGTTKEAVPEVKSLIIQGFKDIESMTSKDLEEAKERLIGLKQISTEESSDVMNALLFYELSGAAEEYYQFEEKVKKVSLQEVKALAKSLIKEYSTAAIVPK